jgi:hypothetical protein
MVFTIIKPRKVKKKCTVIHTSVPVDIKG